MGYEKDLVVLGPDKNMQFLFDGLFSKAADLGVRTPDHQFDAHPLRDAGCLDADEFLESQTGRYAHAIVVTNRETSGRGDVHRIDAEAELEAKLSRTGWGSRARAIVVDPGVGRWMLEHELGEHWSPATPVEDAVSRALRQRRIPQSPARYRALGERLVKEGEPDPAWQRLLSTLKDWFGVAHAGEAVLQARFDALVGRWLEDTRLSSSLRDIVGHPAYQEIIAMGRPVVPLILHDLARQARHWSPALKAITGAAPVPREHAGKVALIAEDWLRWAKANGYVW